MSDTQPPDVLSVISEDQRIELVRLLNILYRVGVYSSRVAANEMLHTLDALPGVPTQADPMQLELARLAAEQDAAGNYVAAGQIRRDAEQRRAQAVQAQPAIIADNGLIAQHVREHYAQPASARPDVASREFAAGIVTRLRQAGAVMEREKAIDLVEHIIREALARVPAPAVSPDLLHRFDEWEKSTEYMRTTTRPMDAGEQMAQRDAHALLLEALALQRARETGA